MKEYWVDIIRRETSFERNVVLVKASSAEVAKARVRAHYMDGEGVQTDGE